MIEFNGTFIVSIISFVVFIFIMNAIFYNPVLSVIKKRDDYISSNYTDAETNNQCAQDLKNKYEYEYENAKLNSRKKMNAQVEESQGYANERIHKARAQAKSEIQTRKDALNIQKNDLINSVNTDDLSNLIVNKILKHS